MKADRSEIFVYLSITYKKTIEYIIHKLNVFHHELRIELKSKYT